MFSVSFQSLQKCCFVNLTDFSNTKKEREKKRENLIQSHCVCTFFLWKLHFKPLCYSALYHRLNFLEEVAATPCGSNLQMSRCISFYSIKKKPLICFYYICPLIIFQQLYMAVKENIEKVSTQCGSLVTYIRFSVCAPLPTASVTRRCWKQAKSAMRMCDFCRSLHHLHPSLQF